MLIKKIECLLGVSIDRNGLVYRKSRTKQILTDYKYGESNQSSNKVKTQLSEFRLAFDLQGDITFMVKGC